MLTYQFHHLGPDQSATVFHYLGCRPLKPMLSQWDGCACYLKLHCCKPSDSDHPDGVSDFTFWKCSGSCHSNVGPDQLIDPQHKKWDVIFEWQNSCWYGNMQRLLVWCCRSNAEPPLEIPLALPPFNSVPEKGQQNGSLRRIHLHGTLWMTYRILHSAAGCYSRECQRTDCFWWYVCLQAGKFWQFCQYPRRYLLQRLYEDNEREWLPLLLYSFSWFCCWGGQGAQSL